MNIRYSDGAIEIIL